MHSFTIGKNDAGQRLDKFLSKALPAIKRSVPKKLRGTVNAVPSMNGWKKTIC